MNCVCFTTFVNISCATHFQLFYLNSISLVFRTTFFLSHRNKLLEKIAESAESLALGDVVDKSIRSNNAWSLLPVQAFYCSVIPGTVMSGYVGGQINFPSWLGRNSKAGKFNR